MAQEQLAPFFAALPECCRKAHGARLSTFRIGGVLACLIEPRTIAEVIQAFEIAQTEHVQTLFLGAGSNLLIVDADIVQPVIRLSRAFNYVTALGSGLFEVGGATSLMTVARRLAKDGYSGLEFAGGIPATIGGATVMNAGAHGGEMADVLDAVQVLLADGQCLWLSAQELTFSYRRTTVPTGAIVLAVRLQLKSSAAVDIQRELIKHLATRKATQPLHMPSAGSVFKNPSTEHSAGWYIEHVGLRGHIVGNAQVSEMHGNWIVNPKKLATAVDVETLIAVCKEKVRSQFGVDLETEVRTWGDSVVPSLVD